MYYATLQDNLIYDDKGRRLVNHEGYALKSYNPNYPEPQEDIYARDEFGNIIFTEVLGENVAVVSEVKTYYGAPTIFYANISFNSGGTVLDEYGLNTGDYNAIISANKGELPFDERTLIWHTSEPVVDEFGRTDPKSADYRVVAVRTSLNEERFILKKRVDDE